MIKNFNTIEEFKKADKSAMLHQAAKSVSHCLCSTFVVSVPGIWFLL